MSNKLFNKKLPRYCEYCAFGNCSGFSNEVICIKRGVTDRQDHCKSYKYDPLKREPKKIKISRDFESNDFSL